MKEDLLLQKDFKIFKHMTAISKNVYFDVLDDIVDNQIAHFIELLGGNLQMLNLIVMLNKMLIPMKKILNLKLLIM